MRKENITLGAIVTIALLCALAVFIIEEVRYTPNKAEFEVITISENAVDLNSASLDKLMTVDTLGEKTAEKIIAFRQTERAFETVEDLMLIEGFGRLKLNRIKGKVYVG